MNDEIEKKFFFGFKYPLIHTSYINDIDSKQRIKMGKIGKRNLKK